MSSVGQLVNCGTVRTTGQHVQGMYTVSLPTAIKVIENWYSKLQISN